MSVNHDVYCLTYSLKLPLSQKLKESAPSWDAATSTTFYTSLTKTPFNFY